MTKTGKPNGGPMPGKLAGELAGSVDGNIMGQIGRFETAKALDWVIRCDQVQARGRTIAFAATAEQCAQFAGEIDVPSCQALTLKGTLTPRSKHRFVLRGRLHAELTLACVVTLDPVAQVIDEELDITFKELTDEERAALQLGGPLGADDPALDVLAVDDPEPIENGKIDLGRFACEVTASNVELFPRAADATLDQDRAPPPSGADAPTASPFAALAKLAKPKPRT